MTDPITGHPVGDGGHAARSLPDPEAVPRGDAPPIRILPAWILPIRTLPTWIGPIRIGSARVSHILSPQISTLPIPGRSRRKASNPGRKPPGAWRALRSWMLAALGLAGAAAPLHAGDWVITGEASERLEASTDRRLEGDDAPLYGSITEFNVNAELRAPRHVLTLQSGIEASRFVGPGDDDGLNRVDPNFAASFEMIGQRWNNVVSASVDLQPTAVSQVETTGVTEENVTQLSGEFSNAFTYTLDPRNRVSLGTSVSLVRFTEGSTALEETSTYGATLGFSHDLTPRLSTDLDLGLQFFSVDDTEETRSLSVSIAPGLSYRLNNAFSVSGGIGLDVTRTRETVFGLRSTDTELGFNGNFELGWTPREDTTLTVEFSQGLEPSSSGQLQRSTRLGIQGSYAVNNRLSLNLGANYLRQQADADQGGGGAVERDLFQITSGASLDLTRHWQLGLGYNFAFENDALQGTAVSNLVFLEISRGLEILP